MILGFKTKFPWGEPTFFPEKILACVNQFINYSPKKHTIRDGQRWKAGASIQMATGVRTKKYSQFNKGTIYQGNNTLEAIQTCVSVQRIDISFRSPEVVAIYIDKKLKYCKNRDHIFEVEPGWLKTFAINDGFNDQEQFFKWFKCSLRNGQLIHWTDRKY